MIVGFAAWQDSGEGAVSCLAYPVRLIRGTNRSVLLDVRKIQYIVLCPTLKITRIRDPACWTLRRVSALHAAGPPFVLFARAGDTKVLGGWGIRWGGVYMGGSARSGRKKRSTVPVLVSYLVIVDTCVRLLNLANGRPRMRGAAGCRHGDYGDCHRFCILGSW